MLEPMSVVNLVGSSVEDLAEQWVAELANLKVGRLVGRLAVKLACSLAERLAVNSEQLSAVLSVDYSVAH
jgi:hypothetical protein